MNRSKRRLLIVLAAAALVPVAAAAAAGDGGPRNPAAEAATGDRDAMRAVVQDVVDCLRERGFDPGDPEVRGGSVVIGDWNPGWDSPAGRATHDCTF
jgi:hypothetical protein